MRRDHRTGKWCILATFLFRQGDVIFNGLFLLCHDTKHRILIQLSGLAKLS